MANTPIIKVSHLVKRYKKAEKNAVDDISFYVEDGAFFSLLGPNGAGKTTTISILTTILSKTAGSLTIAGIDVDTDAAAVRQKIGVIFQNPSLDINLTAEENIRFHATLYNLYRYSPSYRLMSAAYKKQVQELAEVVGLENEMTKKVKNLSGGMKRKLEIIRSLMHHPRVLFLDEPTTGLDPISRKNLWVYLQDIRAKKGITVFLTTHYLEEAEGSDYLCIVDHGQVVAKGTPKEIKASLIKRFVVLDATNRAALVKELHALELKYTGKGPFHINLHNSTGQELLQQITTPLSYLDIHNPSLEDAYVEIIAGNNAQS